MKAEVGAISSPEGSSRLFSTAEVPDPPDGSWIGITETDGSWPQLRLSVPLSFPERWALVLILIAALIGVTVCGVIYFSMQLLENPPWPLVIKHVFSLAVFAAGGCVMVRLLWSLIRREEPESLTLGESELQFDSGVQERYLGPGGEGLDLHHLCNFSSRPAVRTLPRGTFELDLRRFDGRQALLVVSGNEWIEVGRFLREPEREWLLGVLRAWTGEHGSADTRSVVDSPLDAEPARDEPTHLECRREGWESLSFVLRSPDRDRERVKMALIFGLFLCVWTAGGVGAMYGLLQGLDAFPTLLLTAWLGAWLAGGYFVGRAVVSLLRPPEALILTNEALEHDRGCYQYFYEMLDEALWKVGRPQRVSVQRDAISRVRLESIGPRDRLTFDVGADRIEVGRFPGKSERQILARVLEEYIENGLKAANCVQTEVGIARNDT